jgi:NNP family nitrate/nitrite transporter-like MFS transporter
VLTIRLHYSATYAIMVSLFHKFRETNSVHTSWRLSFVAVPVPILTAILVVLFGTDCPTGAWSTRHTTNATAAAVMAGHEVKLDRSEQRTIMSKKQEPTTTVQEVQADDEEEDRAEARPVGIQDSTVIRSDVDVAVNEPLTMKALGKIVMNPLTWLPSLAYMTTFGFELAVDSILANVILKHHPNLGLEKAGYYAAVFGLLNIVTRPLGGILADILYRKHGIWIKKYFMLGLGIGQGVFTIGFGMLLKNEVKPSIGAMMGIIVCLAICNEAANGANFAIAGRFHHLSKDSMLI